MTTGMLCAGMGPARLYVVCVGATDGRWASTDEDCDLVEKMEAGGALSIYCGDMVSDEYDL